MPKQEHRDDAPTTDKLPRLFATKKEEEEEESATAAKIEGWLRLADKVLTKDEPARIEFPPGFRERRSKPRRRPS
jgi:hypothetical protein